VVPATDEVGLERVDEVLRQHLLDVRSGGERLLRAGHHDGRDVAVVLERIHGFVQLGDQLTVQRVHRLGPVQGDQADRAALFHEDGLVGHERCS
jgi:hypothetical protein